MTLRPYRALRAVAALIRDPDQTFAVFTLIEALTGRSTPAWIAWRLRGTSLLRDRSDVMLHLMDRQALRKLPAGSLARAYLRFVEAQGFSPEGLKAASRQGESGGSQGPSEVEFIHDRMRDTHDLWHVVLGYGGDVLGEAALLAFTFAQTANPAIGILVLVGLTKLRAPAARRLIGDAFVRGLRAAWLPAQEWERLLSLPLAEVRELLRVGATRDYTPVRTSDLRAAGLLRARKLEGEPPRATFSEP